MARIPNPPEPDIPELEAATDDTADYLGDPATLDAILRNFLADAILARETEPNVEQWLAERIARDGATLLGKSNSVTPVPGWNAPDGGIINGIRTRYDVKADTPEKIIAVPFYAILEDYMTAVDQAAEGKDWEHIIDGAIELAVATLLGTDAELYPFEP